MTTAITLEFASAAVDDAKAGCLTLCRGIRSVAFYQAPPSLLAGAMDTTVNCTAWVDMATYKYESVPGHPEQLDLVHMALRHPLPDTRIFAQDARNNLTAYLQANGFFKSQDSKVVMITMREDSETLGWAIITLFAIVLLVLLQYMYKSRQGVYSKIAQVAPEDSAVLSANGADEGNGV